MSEVVDEDVNSCSSKMTRRWPTCTTQVGAWMAYGSPWPSPVRRPSTTPREPGARHRLPRPFDSPRWNGFAVLREPPLRRVCGRRTFPVIILSNYGEKKLVRPVG